MQSTRQLSRAEFMILTALYLNYILLKKGNDGHPSIMDVPVAHFIKPFIDCVIYTTVDGEFLFTPFGKA